jgi:GNAT superfamily N-acetyltransferase
MTAVDLQIRPAGSGDADVVIQFIRELAEYERLADRVSADAADIARALDDGRIAVLLAEADGEPAGFALYFFNFSTFIGRSGLYLEDLFVRPRYRGLGLGRRLLQAAAAVALEGGAERMDWAVLDWNTTAIAFYERLGATHQGDWLPFRLEGEPLRRLARPSRETET